MKGASVFRRDVDSPGVEARIDESCCPAGFRPNVRRHHCVSLPSIPRKYWPFVRWSRYAAGKSVMRDSVSPPLFWYIVQTPTAELVVRQLAQQEVVRVSPAPYGPYTSKEEAEREVPFVIPRADWKLDGLFKKHGVNWRRCRIRSAGHCARSS
jgi:hypothetical protein